MIKNLSYRVSAYNTPYEDETDETLIKIFLEADITILRNVSANMGLFCLRWISEQNMTFYNQKQVYEIVKNELPLLRKDITLNQDLLDTIEKISSVVFEGYQFLRFKPVLN